MNGKFLTLSLISSLFLLKLDAAFFIDVDVFLNKSESRQLILWDLENNIEFCSPFEGFIEIDISEFTSSPWEYKLSVYVIVTGKDHRSKFPGTYGEYHQIGTCELRPHSNNATYALCIQNGKNHYFDNKCNSKYSLKQPTTKEVEIVAKKLLENGMIYSSL